MTSVKAQSSTPQKKDTVRNLKGASMRTALCTIYCSTHSIITERVASHLHVSRFQVSVNMKGPVSTVHLNRRATVKVGPTFPSPEKVTLDAAITTLSFSSTSFALPTGERRSTAVT